MTWLGRILAFTFGLVFGGVLVLVADYATAQEPIITESTSEVTTQGSMTTTVNSPPPSAISPQIMSNGNSDLCTVGVAGAVQTQILGISMGSTVRDINCERLKNAKTLYDMGMKVAAVSTMCQDKRIFQAMMDAGTPCPYDGLIGDAAKAAWEQNPEKQPDATDNIPQSDKKTIAGATSVLGLLGFLLIL